MQNYSRSWPRRLKRGINGVTMQDTLESSSLLSVRDCWVIRIS